MNSQSVIINHQETPRYVQTNSEMLSIPVILENRVQIDATVGTISSGKRASAKSHSESSASHPTALITCQ